MTMADTPAQVALDEKLLPCPFCGGDKIRDSHIRDGRNVGCTECGAAVHAFQPNAQAEAYAKWNRRALSSLCEAGDDGQGALVERLQAQLRKAADEMREEGHKGWPVTCDDAADRIEALTRQNAVLRADKERLERERDGARQDAERLLVSFVREHCDPVEGWTPLPDLEGIITQLDNATTITREFKKRAEAAERRLAEQWQAQGEAMTVINPEEWEPCSPSYLARGGSCAAPRVWNAAEQNHYHPRLATPPTPEPDASHATETYYTKGKNAEWVEGLSDKDLSWALTRAAQDVNDSDENVSEWMPVTAFLDVAADRIKALSEPDAELVHALERACQILASVERNVKAPRLAERVDILDFLARHRKQGGE